MAYGDADGTSAIPEIVPDAEGVGERPADGTCTTGPMLQVQEQDGGEAVSPGQPSIGCDDGA